MAKIKIYVGGNVTKVYDKLPDEEIKRIYCAEQDKETQYTQLIVGRKELRTFEAERWSGISKRRRKSICLTGTFMHKEGESRNYGNAEAVVQH